MFVDVDPVIDDSDAGRRSWPHAARSVPHIQELGETKNEALQV